MEKLSRRNFFKKSGGAIAAAGIALPVVGAVLSSCESDENTVKNTNSDNPNIIKLSEYADLNNAGGSAKLVIEGKNNDKPIIIIRKEGDTFLVVSSVCTHNGCEVSVSTTQSGVIACPCHNARFSTVDASVLQKPADNSDIEPLTKFNYAFDSDSQELEILF